MKDSKGQSLTAASEEQLKSYAAELDSLIRPLLGIDLLVRPKVEQQVFQRIRQELGERDLREKVQTARAGKLGGDNALEKYKKFFSVYEAAEALGKLHIAESWLSETLNVINDAPASFKDGERDTITKKLNDVRSSSLATSMFFLF